MSVYAPSSRAALLIALLVLGLGYGSPQASAGAVWRQGVEVVYDASHSPLPETEVAAALEYVIASWGARVDLPLARIHAAPGTGYQAGRIVIRWVDSLEQIRNGANILGLASTRRWTWSATQTIAGAEIYLHGTALRLRGGGACFTHALLHEMGHALGISHVADAGAVMYEGLGDCHHTLTLSDIAAAPYRQHLCHAELLPNLDIYIPVLAAGERAYSGRLRHEDGVWTVVERREVSPRADCTDVRLVDGKLQLHKLWSPQALLRAELAPGAAGEWLLLRPAL